MRVLATPYEAILEGTAIELAEVAKTIAALRPPALVTLSTRSEESHSSARHVHVRATEEAFHACWSQSGDLSITGSPEALAAFAEMFTFRCEPVRGVHSHWDPASLSGLVDPESLPIVIQIAAADSASERAQ